MLTNHDFQTEIDVLAKTAEKLGEFGRAGDKDNFVNTLQALGMSREEAEDFWASLDHPLNRANGVPWRETKDNTDLSSHLGVRLNPHRHPRNLLLYRLLECSFPDIIHVEVSGIEHIGGLKSKNNAQARRLEFTKRPLDPNDRTMAVHRIYKGEEPQKFFPKILRAARTLRGSLGDEIGLKLAQVLFGCKMVIPFPKMARLLAKAIKAGQEGQEVTMAGAFCPDYAYEETGNPQIPYRYTFEGLGEGVGLVAQQFVRIIPHMHTLLNELGVRHKIVLGIGDFEADDQNTLERVKLDRTAFIAKCQRSLDAFRAQVPSEIPMTLELFDTARGNGRLRPYATEATSRMKDGDFGRMPDLFDDLRQCIGGIHDQYDTFYRRWYGDGISAQEVRNIIFTQGGEYASIARIYQEDFGDNVIILAGDRPEMHRFNAFFQLQPTLCAKRAY
ncbi:MAG: hypothetical protein Q7S57_01035 [bacterium]|nr:hypothetical protein [bacterium]